MVYVVFQSGTLANGGVESATQILEGLRTPRIVVTQLESAATERFRAAGCDVRIWPVTGKTPKRALHWNRKIFELCRQHQVRVVHCNDISAFWHAAPGARAASAKVIFNVRDIFEEGRAYGPRWRSIHHLASEIVCLSRNMEETVMQRFPPLSPRLPRAVLSFTYSAIDLRKMSPALDDEKTALRASFGFSKDDFAVAYVGAVCEKKNQLGFIEGVLPEVMSRVPSLSVNFFGDFDPERDPYARRCLDAASPWIPSGRVRFPGFVAETERVYKSHDVVALASRYEGLARCMIESLACGTPVVSFDVTSAREILEVPKTGFVSTRYDYTSMAQSIERLAVDFNLRATMQENARALALRAFDPRKSVAAYEERYARWSR
jgi:glycosyltransferase involved in cell wall biosynthesis